MAGAIIGALFWRPTCSSAFYGITDVADLLDGPIKKRRRRHSRDGHVVV
jgi:hypothetical protein